MNKMEFKNSKKQKWIKPKLTILIKSLPEENVLDPCSDKACVIYGTTQPAVGMGGS